MNHPLFQNPYADANQSVDAGVDKYLRDPYAIGQPKPDVPKPQGPRPPSIPANPQDAMGMARDAAQQAVNTPGAGAAVGGATGAAIQEALKRRMGR